MPAEHVKGISLPRLHRVGCRRNHSVILNVHTSYIPLVLTGEKYRDTTLQMNTVGRFRVFIQGRESESAGGKLRRLKRGVQQPTLAAVVAVQTPFAQYFKRQFELQVVQ